MSFSNLDDFPYNPINHYKKLDRLKNEIVSKKVEVHQKITECKRWLDERQTCLFNELDDLYREVEGMVAQHSREITTWNEKLDLLNESFQLDIINQGNRTDLKSIQNNLHELLSKKIQIPSLRLIWDEELHTKIHTLYRITTRIPPYEERNLPIWGGIGGEKGRSAIWGPVSVSIHPISEDIFVAEAKQNRIQVYSKNGVLQHTIRDKQLKEPWFMALTNSHLFTTCLHNNMVHKFSISTRKRVASWQNTQLLSGVTVAGDKVYACVCEGNSIVKFDFNLNKVGVIKLNISKGVKMYDIKSINNKFYFLTDGSHILHTITEGELEMDQMIPNYFVGRACHFVIDRQMNFLLTDTNDHQVKVFSETGKLVNTLGRKGNGLGEFLYPEGIALDREERVLVMDFKESNRLQIF